MKIGIIGSGVVAQTLGAKLIELGHDVVLGTRDPKKLDEKKNMASDAARVAAGRPANKGEGRDLPRGGGARRAAHQRDPRAELRRGAQAGGRGQGGSEGPASTPRTSWTSARGCRPGALASQDNCLGEKIQAAFPNLRVVKSLNTIGAPVMVKPKAVDGGDHTVFVSGNDPAAKAAVDGAAEVVRLDRRARSRRRLVGARPRDVHGDVDPPVGRHRNRHAQRQGRALNRAMGAGAQAAQSPSDASAPSSSPFACPSPRRTHASMPRSYTPRASARSPSASAHVARVQVRGRVVGVLAHQRLELVARLREPARVLVLLRQPVARKRIARPRRDELLQRLDARRDPIRPSAAAVRGPGTSPSIGTIRFCAST